MFIKNVFPLFFTRGWNIWSKLYLFLHDVKRAPQSHDVLKGCIVSPCKTCQIRQHCKRFSLLHSVLTVIAMKVVSRWTTSCEDTAIDSGATPNLPVSSLQPIPILWFPTKSTQHEYCALPVWPSVSALFFITCAFLVYYDPCHLRTGKQKTNLRRVSASN